MGKFGIGGEKMKKKYILFLSLFLFIDLFGVLYPNFRAVWDYRQEQAVLKQRILRYEMHETKKSRPSAKKQEDYIFDLDEQIKQFDMQVKERKMEYIDKDMQFDFQLQCSSKQLSDFFQQKEWKKEEYLLQSIEVNLLSADTMEAMLQMKVGK